MLALMSAMSVILTLSVFFPPFLHYSVIPSCFWSPSLLPSCKAPPSMADSSMLTLGTARSLLVDSSVCETTKDHVFLGVTCEDGEGRCVVRLLRQRKPNSCINYSGIPAVHLSAHPPLPSSSQKCSPEWRRGWSWWERRGGTQRCSKPSRYLISFSLLQLRRRKAVQER